MNRQQAKDDARILAPTVPAMLEIMIKNPHEDCGEIMYPVVDQRAQDGQECFTLGCGDPWRVPH